MILLVSQASIPAVTRASVLHAVWKCSCKSAAHTRRSSLSHATPTSLLTRPPICLLFTDRRLVRVTGHLVHSDILGKVLSLLPCPTVAKGRHLQTITMPHRSCAGMAVNPSETRMVVTGRSHGVDGNKLYVYSLPRGQLLFTVGERGKLPGQLHVPERVCFGPGDVIIVADHFNNRLQQFSSTGEFMRHMDVKRPYSLCINRACTLIGIGTSTYNYKGKIVLMDYETGTKQRSIAGAPLSGCVFSIRFTPDDTHVIITCATLCALVYSVIDGSCVHRLCDWLSTDKVIGYPHDILWTERNDIIVANCIKHRIEVYEWERGPVLRWYGRQGDGCGQFQVPIAVALVNGRLYVLDSGSTRVQVLHWGD